MSLKDLIEHGTSRLGISEAELSRRAGLTQGAITRWKQGTRTPRLGALQKLAAALEMPLADLVQASLRERTPSPVARARQRARGTPR